MQIFVLGMHRSGTSALARIINLMGAYVGGEGILMEPNRENPKGFWERKDVREVHQGVFKTIGVEWDKVAHLDLRKLTENDHAAFEKKARTILQNLDAHRPWVLKDPRLCLLLPLWRPLLEVPICVHIYRRPLEVAQSLRTRNGFSIYFGAALWEKYNLAALAHSRELPRLFVAHHRLLRQPLETVRALYEQLLALDVQGLRLPSEREILAFLDPALYRERGDPSLEKEFINFSQEALFQAFAEGTIDNFDDVPSLSAGALEALENHALEEERERQRRGEVETLQQQITEAEQKRVTLEQRTTAEAKTWQRRLTEAEQGRRAEVQTLQQQITEAEQKRVALEQRTTAEAKTWQQRLTEAEQGRRAEVQTLQQQLTEAEQKRVALEQRTTAEAKTWQQRLTEAEQERRAEVQTLQQQIAERERAFATVQEQHVAFQQSKAAEGKALQQKLTEAEHAREAVEEQLTALTQARAVEVQTLQRQIAQVEQALVAAHERVVSLEQGKATEGKALQRKLTEIEETLAAAQKRVVSLEQGKAAEGKALQRQLSEAERVLADRERQLSVHVNELQQYSRDSAQLLGWISKLDRAFVSVLNSQRWRLGHTVAVFYRKLRCKSPLPMPQDYGNNLREEIRVWRVAFDKRHGAAQREVTPNREIAASPEAAQVPRELLPPMKMGPGEVKKKVTPEEMEPEKISVIILNRNGASHLQNLFASLVAYNTYRNVEFLVVDHASSDQSLGVLRAWQSYLPITLIPCDKNYSFSYSNNEAAKKAGGQYLFFLNNDIIFDKDVLPLLLAQFQISEPEVGVVGVKLVYPSHHGTSAHQVQHAGIKFSEDISHHFYRPYELGIKAHAFLTSTLPEIVPAVTGAALLCRREEFLSLGGFCEEYYYGYEDVDLCLSYFAQRKQVSRCLTATRLIHDEGATRRLEGREDRSARIRGNQKVLQQRYGYAIKKAVQIDMVQGTSFWTNVGLVVAFAVTEAHEQAKAGDYFTAAELAFACEGHLGWQVRFCVRDQDWYDLNGVDVLIVMVDSYDLTQITGAKPTLVKIAWLRNWFERWGQRVCFDDYDIYLCSSQKGAHFLEEHYGKRPHVFRIATNERRFMPGHEQEKYHSDYCFTGSRWNVNRDIELHLDPTQSDYQFALYGTGWDAQTKFRQYWKGFVPYEELPLVYASTKVVIDDANHVTKPWGSVNSRVFDALASGTLVLTNGEEGAEEVFAGRLPTYHDGKDLHSLLTRYLRDEEARRTLVADLRKTVLAQHTYTHRAVQLQSLLIDFRDRKFRIAIKVPVPSLEVAPEWGDYHFARALKRAFVKQGHAVRIDILPDWETARGFGDDVVLVLRGLSQYLPKPEQINLMWNISHPDQVSIHEYEQYDHVFVASNRYTEQLRTMIKTPVSALLQCTDPSLFYPDTTNGVPAEPVLFVGNSRKQLRTIVKDALAADVPLAIYGTRWEGLVPPQYVKGTHIENTTLRRYYSQCKVLLNDHWPSMREQGFISNRIFDAGACGALIVSDEVADLEATFGDTVVSYRDATDLKRLVAQFVQDDSARREKGARLHELVLRAHTFAHRTALILQVIEEIGRRKRFATVGAATGGRRSANTRGRIQQTA